MSAQQYGVLTAIAMLQQRFVTFLELSSPTNKAKLDALVGSFALNVETLSKALVRLS
ncbi:MAG TPA: hypothetical protein VIT23_08080 [Terrimicrobiaceae bacterium]